MVPYRVWDCSIRVESRRGQNLDNNFRGTLPLKFGTNDTLALTIDGAAGAATFSGNVLVNSGSIILYGDGDALFAGTSANMSWDRSDSALEFQDNAKIKLGTGDDLQIYHDGTSAYIANTTGSTYFNFV